MAKMWAGRTDGTTEKIADDFNNGINPTVNSDTGEKLVSEISRRTFPVHVTSTFKT